jgi:hypothetical protein
MTDFINCIMECRSGEVAVDLNEKFNKALKSVLETQGSAELAIKLKISPSKLAMGGGVIEVKLDYEAKVKLPEIPVGDSLFYVDDGDLVRDPPNQTKMFEADETNKQSGKEQKRGGN